MSNLFSALTDLFIVVTISNIILRVVESYLEWHTKESDPHETIRLRYGFKLYWKKIDLTKIKFYISKHFNRCFYYLCYNPKFKIGEMCN